MIKKRFTVKFHAEWIKLSAFSLAFKAESHLYCVNVTKILVPISHLNRFHADMDQRSTRHLNIRAFKSHVHVTSFFAVTCVLYCNYVIFHVDYHFVLQVYTQLHEAWDRRSRSDIDVTGLSHRIHCDQHPGTDRRADPIRTYSYRCTRVGTHMRHL